MKTPFCLSALAAVALAMTSTMASANVEYECGELDGVLLSAIYFDEEDLVEVIGVNLAGERRSEIFRPAISGSGARYVSAQGDAEFIEHQGRAFLAFDGLQLDCTVFAITEPGGGTTFFGGNGGGGAGDAFDNFGNPIPQNVGPFNGFSFGGNLRAGPGTNFADVGSTFNGQQLTLLNDTGVYFNGYSWWIVQLQNGQQAHQWGGLLCSPGNLLVGVFNDGC